MAKSLTQIQRLTAALEEVMERRAIEPWLRTPNEAFGGLAPLEVVERGQTNRLWQMIYQLRSGNPY